MSDKKQVLGKSFSALGLKELLGGSQASSDESIDLVQVSVNDLASGQYQPRKLMNDTALNELAQSIKEQGMVQPIVIRPIGSRRYEIIAGERRWRAAMKAGLVTVPAIIKEVSDQSAMAMALIENLQREDLNVMESAHAFDRLIEEFSMTHEEIAKAVGKSRVAITHILRLLKLESKVKMWLENGALSKGHGKALLAVPQEKQVELAQRVVQEGLSVRETEQLVQRMQQRHEKTPQAKTVLSPSLQSLQAQFTDQFGIKVHIKPSPKGGGQVVLRYQREEDLLRLLNP